MISLLTLLLQCKLMLMSKRLTSEGNSLLSSFEQSKITHTKDTRHKQILAQRIINKWIFVSSTCRLDRSAGVCLYEHSYEQSLEGINIHLNVTL